MAKQFHVYGPTVLRYHSAPASGSPGTGLLGQSNGQALITVRDVLPMEPVTTDDYGGEPKDFIQKMQHAIVVATLIDWDDAIIREIISGITAASTAGAPAFAARGTAGAVGMLRINDGGFRALWVEGSKATAQAGGQILKFPRALRDPNVEVELQNIGAARAGEQVLAFRCFPDASGKIYDYVDI